MAEQQRAEWHSKYTAEEMRAALAPRERAPQRKYATEEERRAAFNEAQRRGYARRRALERGEPIPPGAELRTRARCANDGERRERHREAQHAIDVANAADVTIRSVARYHANRAHI